MRVELLTNTSENNHLSALNQLLSKADEVYMATAFLRVSGLSQLLPGIKKCLSNEGKVTMIIGKNFAQTEPEALRKLHQLSVKRKNLWVRFSLGLTEHGTFHPKVFLIKKGRDADIITGSANITGGGLVSNEECSLWVQAKSTEDIYKDTKAYLVGLTSDEYSEDLSLLVINKYETFFNKFKNIRKSIKQSPEHKGELEFNYTNLLKHLKAFDKEQRANLQAAKKRSYNKARKVLEEIAYGNRLTEKKFADLLDELVGSAGAGRLWHSGSLYRHRRLVYPNYKKFKRLVRYAIENANSDPAVVYEHAKELVNKIDGAGPNYVAEILMTIRPKKFANLNRNPITVLRDEAGVALKATSGSFSGDDYSEYCSLVKEICQKLELEDMLEADTFFNEIYWKIYKKD